MWNVCVCVCLMRRKVFLSAGIMQWIESELISAESKAKCSSNGCLNFLDAFYYIIVTTIEFRWLLWGMGT